MNNWHKILHTLLLYIYIYICIIIHCGVISINIYSYYFFKLSHIDDSATTSLVCILFNTFFPSKTLTEKNCFVLNKGIYC